MARGVDELTVMGVRLTGPRRFCLVIGSGAKGGASLTRHGPISTLVQSPLGAVAVLC